MITIDTDYLASRDFSGQVILCFDRGELTHYKLNETVSAKDADMRNKLLLHGIRRQASYPSAGRASERRPMLNVEG